MADPVSYTVEDLNQKIAELYMECTARAKREDYLNGVIKQLQDFIIQLQQPQPVEVEVAEKIARKPKAIPA